MTGLEGRITMGPITPVCIPEVPCDAPVSGSFIVTWQQHRVAVFQSDAEGRYAVHLPPGSYLVAPGPGSPIPAALEQALAVDVESGEGLTSRDLQFSTGLR